MEQEQLQEQCPHCLGIVSDCCINLVILRDELADLKRLAEGMAEEIEDCVACGFSFGQTSLNAFRDKYPKEQA